MKRYAWIFIIATLVLPTIGCGRLSQQVSPPLPSAVESAGVQPESQLTWQADYDSHNVIQVQIENHGSATVIEFRQSPISGYLRYYDRDGQLLYTEQLGILQTVSKVRLSESEKWITQIEMLERPVQAASVKVEICYYISPGQVMSVV
ncbi:hypothetical protein EBR96_10245, partial [bacterium]|nr:hypothetical protein [bacterium]